MPKIDAPTVAEHHARQRAAIVAVARTLLGRGGVPAVTPGTVARETGLARTSVYQYFPSTDALVTAAIEDLFRDATDRIADTLGPDTDARSRIHAYITVALHAAAGDYGPFHGIAAADLPEGARRRLPELRAQISDPLTAAVAELGAPHPDQATALVIGAIAAGIGMIRHGAPADQTRTAVYAFITGGLRETATSSGPRALQTPTDSHHRS